MFISRKFCNRFFCIEGEKALTAVLHRLAKRRLSESFMVRIVPMDDEEVKVEVYFLVF
jgi:hypothetical protein